MQDLLTKTVRAGLRLELNGEDLRVIGPAHAITQDLREALRANKDALIQRLRQMAERPGGAGDALPELIPSPEERHEAFPLTDVQHAYWMGRHDLVELGKVATHFYFELNAQNLDCARLEDSLCQLIKRHEMMRAVVDDSGQQRVLNDVPRYRIELNDLRSVSHEIGRNAVLQTRDTMSHAVRPAAQWPLFEVKASLLPEGQVRLHISLDMLIMDAWSMFVLFQEWHELYEHPSLALAPIGLSYRDYVMAERRLLGGPAYERARNYWNARVDSLPAAPELPIRQSGVNAVAPRFSRRRHHIEAARWTNLRERARTEGLTPSGLLLAAYAEVLTRWSSSAHYTLNLTLFNRMPVHPDVFKLVGDFTSLTMLEVDHRAVSSSFLDRASLLQRQLMQDLEHREFSGVQVLREWTQRQRTGMYAAMPVVFTSALVLSGGEVGQDASLVERFGPMVYGVSQTPQVWLDNQVMEVAGELVFNWDAVDDLFEPRVLDEMFSAYRELLELLADEPGAWARSVVIPLRLTYENSTDAQTAPKTIRPLHAGLLKHARKTPDALAVIGHDRSLSYRELLNESAIVADWLREHQMGSGKLVAVLMRKGWEQPVAVLGTLLAGAAYMPIDADLPLQRQRELLKLGRVSCILTQANCSPLLQTTEWGTDYEVLELLQPSDGVSFDLADVEEVWVDAAQLAYVIFTSGTTGKPKGVMMGHGAVVNTIQHVNQRLGLLPSDRVLSVSSLSFDLSVYDIFGVIDAGAALVLPNPALRLDALHWSDLMTRCSVTIWNSAPQLMRMLMDTGHGSETTGASGLRAVLLSGDWIPVDLPDRISSVYPSAQMISLGGATEAAIWSIWYTIGLVATSWNSIPYGVAMPNQSVQVLNNRFEVCPEQVRGKIYIGGQGLSQGYWDDFERTELRFVRSPISGERLYDTGDLGRYMADGNIEFLGRGDDQVKIRGHRVEPEEVAAVLRQHADVKEAVVLATGERLERHLVAYIELVTCPPMEELGRRECVDSELSLAQSLRLSMTTASLRSIDKGLKSAWSRLDDYYIASVVLAFRRLGVAGQPLELLTIQDMMKRGVVGRYQRWLLRGFEALREVGYLRCISTGVYEIERDWPTADLVNFSVEIQNCLCKTFEFSIEDAVWFTGAAENLHDILTERVHSAEIYTADATARVYQKLFLDNHTQLSKVCAAILRRPHQSTLSVLEVGAGLGSATQHVLPVVAQDTRYVFTDISDFFLSRAQDLFGHQHAGIEFMRYDVDIPPEFQGLERNSFDVVLASSMLHDVRDVGAALVHILDLLKPGGKLVILEETRFFHSFDLHMGLQQGFDGFTDTNLRTEHCLLSTAQWEQAMRHAGFSDVLAVSEVGSSIEYLGFSVIVATAPLQITRLDPLAVRDYLGARLPDYMLPTQIVHMSRIPVTGNGKLDYKALPKIPEKLVNHQQHVEPRNQLEQALLQIWTVVLKVPAIGTTDNFFDLGGDSLIATQMVREIRNKMEVELDIHEFLYNATVQALAELIESKGAGVIDSTQAVAAVFPALTDIGPEQDLEDIMIQLAPLSFQVPQPLREPKTILLTGATGWLGAHLLCELLCQSEARIICLVRALDSTQAHRRILANLEYQGLSLSDEYASRIRAIPADLSQPQFGLSESVWFELCKGIDRIFHAAASVDTVGKYVSLRGANVIPILDLLRLADAHHNKPVIFASTLAVCIRHTAQGFSIRTDETLSERPDGLVVGYAQTKWVAEQLLWKASVKGLPVKLFRIPHVLPAMSCSKRNQDNILGSLLSIAVNVPALPDWSDSRVDGISVDRIARLMVREGLLPTLDSAVVHLVAETVASLPEVIWQMRGKDVIETLPVIARDEWIELCRQAIHGREHMSNVILDRLFALTDAGVLIETMFGSAKVDTSYLRTGADGRFPQRELLLEATYWLDYGRVCI